MGVLRVLLALSVVISHLGGFFGVSLVGGTASVQMFYVISGFYMATILTEKYDPRRDIWIFFSNRFLRIYSIYFVCLVLSLAVYALLYIAGLGGWFFPEAAANGDRLGWFGKVWLAFTHVFVVGQETTLFLEYTDNGLGFTPNGPSGPLQLWRMLAVPQAWSISLELMFYCIVPFLIRYGTRTLCLIIAATLALRFATYAAGYEIDPWINRFFPFELGLFVLGMVARRIYDSSIGGISRDVQIAIVIIFFIVSCFVRELMFYLKMVYVMWPYYFSALIVLPCLFQLTRHNKFDGFIGTFSYPLYLVHWLVMTTYDSLAPKMNWPTVDSNIRVAACVLVSFLLSWLIVIIVEAPLDRFRQRRYAALASG
jgi:peptidoglycan/LPS O-acetylase OafA/YrhL